jgi:hypothetical protein
MSKDGNIPARPRDERVLKESNLQWTVAIIIIVVSGIFIFTPEYLIAKQISKYAVHLPAHGHPVHDNGS